MTLRSAEPTKKEEHQGVFSSPTRNRNSIWISIALILVVIVSCAPIQPAPTVVIDTPQPSPTPEPEITRTPIPTRPVYAPATLVDYIAQPGDSLAALADHFNTTTAEILEANPLINKGITTLAAGLELKIPIYYEALWGSQFQIIPDSLFVNGPAQVGFNTTEFVDAQPGWLKGYSSLAGSKVRRGGNLIDYVAQTFSISPRVLLALAEYQSGALSQPQLDPDRAIYPLGYEDQFHRGFYLQLVWAANTLNNGYYAWRNGRLGDITLPNGALEVPDPWQNAASVALHYYYAQLFSGDDYNRAIFDDGFYGTYTSYFGDPWANFQSHIPGNLQQPELALPFAVGKKWAFTGGPHAAWGSGEPLAAIDFAPPALVGGCVYSPEYVVAMAEGQIVRSDSSVAMLDLDKDGDERTGWVILYLHLGLDEMVRPGVLVKTGDPIGHPSCEGGSATGTHVHIARKYNGEWIVADSAIPFNLEGWIVRNGSAPYQGTLERYGKVVTASVKGLTFSVITAGTK
jgi:murein DD-endopeptidase MepM/ murein hydrolase activator NlpD